MASRGVRRGRAAEEEESYFVSMADMMVGLVFVFVVLLLYFALQFRQTTQDLAGGERARTAILVRLEQALRARGLAVSIDTGTGVLRLPEDVLFDRGAAALSARGRQAVVLLGGTMADVLPCYAWPRPARGCPPGPARLDAVFVEGHTDSDPVAGGAAGYRDNLDLSVMRAANTYRALIAATPALAAMRNRPTAGAAPQPILSVSGYGADRPAVPGDDAAAKRRNRRIDLRFLMAAPDVPPAR